VTLRIIAPAFHVMVDACEEYGIGGLAAGEVQIGRLEHDRRLDQTVVLRMAPAVEAVGDHRVGLAAGHRVDAPAATLTGIGGVIGVIFGIGFSALIATFVRVEPGVSPVLTSIAVVVSVGIGIVFGMVPAIRASRLDPVEALRYE